MATKQTPPEKSAKKTPKKKKPEDKRGGIIGIFVIGLIAVVFGVVEGFIVRSTNVYTGSSGTFTMDPITSILMILAGLLSMGFAIWLWRYPEKS